MHDSDRDTLSCFIMLVNTTTEPSPSTSWAHLEGHHAAPVMQSDLDFTTLCRSLEIVFYHSPPHASTTWGLPPSLGLGSGCLAPIQPENTLIDGSCHTASSHHRTSESEVV